MTNLGSLGLLLFCTATDGANLRLCEHALARAETLGIKCQLLNIATVKLPLFVSFEGEKPDPEIMDPLIETFTQATGFFFLRSRIQRADSTFISQPHYLAFH